MPLAPMQESPPRPSLVAMTHPTAVAERREFSAEELDYLRQHRRDLDRWLDEGRFQYWILGVAVVLGLLAHALGYVLRTSGSGEPVAFLGDLVYSLGLALWTGSVVAFFIQVFPEAKRRQIKRYLSAYDAIANGSGANGARMRK
jgi:hypothetical protein